MRQEWGIVFEVVTLLLGIALLLFETVHTDGYGSLDIVGLILVGVSAIDVYLRKAQDHHAAP